jgi:hypothetical protein
MSSSCPLFSYLSGRYLRWGCDGALTSFLVPVQEVMMMMMMMMVMMNYFRLCGAETLAKLRFF